MHNKTLKTHIYIFQVQNIHLDVEVDTDSMDQLLLLAKIMEHGVHFLHVRPR